MRPSVHTGGPNKRTVICRQFLNKNDWNRGERG